MALKLSPSGGWVTNRVVLSFLLLLFCVLLRIIFVQKEYYYQQLPTCIHLLAVHINQINRASLYSFV